MHTPPHAQTTTPPHTHTHTHHHIHHRSHTHAHKEHESALTRILRALVLTPDKGEEGEAIQADYLCLFVCV